MKGHTMTKTTITLDPTLHLSILGSTPTQPINLSPLEAGKLINTPPQFPPALNTFDACCVAARRFMGKLRRNRGVGRCRWPVVPVEAS